MRYRFCFVIFALLVAACSSDEELADSAATSSVTLRIAAADSRAADTAVPADELMQTWWVAFVNEGGEVAKVISRDAAATDAVEEDRYSCQMPNGTYRVYAFANVTVDELRAATGYSFAEGAILPDDMEAVTWRDDLNEWSGRLPMSGYVKSLTVAKGAMCDIEVVRLVAKVQVDIIDRSTDRSATTLSAVTLSPVTVGPFPLLPDYAALGTHYAPASPAGLTSRAVRLAADAFADAGDRRTAYFYIRESSATDGLPAANPSGRFQIQLDVTRGGATESRLFAITDELTSLRRNDYVTIPLVLTDYELEVEALFYPPIGGYPAVVTVRQGDDYTVTFGSAGDFAIVATVRDAALDAAPEPIVPEAVALTVADPDSIFATAPAVDAVTGEIVGTLSGTLGTATVTLAVTVRQSDTISHTFRRTIYIIRASATAKAATRTGEDVSKCGEGRDRLYACPFVPRGTHSPAGASLCIGPDFNRGFRGVAIGESPAGTLQTLREGSAAARLVGRAYRNTPIEMGAYLKDGRCAAMLLTA